MRRAAAVSNSGSVEGIYAFIYCTKCRAYRFGVQVLAVLVVVYILQVLAVLYILQVMAVLYLFIYFIVDE